MTGLIVDACVYARSISSRGLVVTQARIECGSIKKTPEQQKIIDAKVNIEDVPGQLGIVENIAKLPLAA